MKKKIGALFVGALGSISTTVIAGAFAKKLGLMEESYLTTDNDQTLKALNLVPIEDIVFGGWDIVKKDLYTAALEHKVVKEKILVATKDKLQEVVVLAGAATNDGGIIDSFRENAIEAPSRRAITTALINDIEKFKSRHGLDHVIVVNLSSTDKFLQVQGVPEYQSIENFESGLDQDSSRITFGMLYAYAAIMTKSPYVNFTPSVTVDIPALMDLMNQKGVVVAGKDGKTGQTLYKTVIAPMLKARSLKLTGWYSVNILGNKDGEVLNSPENLKTKIETKTGVLSEIMGYDNFDHQVKINYYKPRGDAKEAWDNIDFCGWLGEEMSMKINWVGKDSILAAPLILDLIRLTDFFYQKGEKGVLTQLACYFKSPYNFTNHDFFVQWGTLTDHVSQQYLQQGSTYV